MSVCYEEIQSEREEHGVSWYAILVDPTRDLQLTIQIRCREIDWRSRWYWGLECLNASNKAADSQPTQSQADYEGREVERWLKGTRVSAKEVDVSG